MTAPLRSTIIGLTVGAMALLAAPAKATPSAPASSPAAGVQFAVIPGSLSATTDADTGAFSSTQMSVEVVLAPRNESLLSGLLSAVYTSDSGRYHNWLEKGQFNTLFAPSGTQTAAVAAYLRASGLVVAPSSSPFLLRASGASRALESAFKTSLHTFRNGAGATYFSNAAAVQLPTSLAAGVVGVVGLSNTVRSRSQVKLPLSHQTSPAVSCQAPYPTRAQLFAAVNEGISFPFGYGRGPGCNGLTPAQDNSIYSAPTVGARGRGLGVNLAVFELSAYQRSDIVKWAQNFYGKSYNPRLVDIIVDGGPLSPICPPGDTCPPNFNGYSGDIEVDADIETQLAISPQASHILVYNAPNDFTGQTELDEYAQIASDDLADVVSSSWAECEKDAGSAYAQVENLVFEQMALQGQSMFGAEGDTGAFSCIRSDGTTGLALLDPPAQPWVTSVGGTSLESFNPESNPSPGYPPAGVETVWNVDNLCNASASEGGHPGVFWCAETGAGGGGNSLFWKRPFYQNGPGITNPYTAYGNGTTKCVLAPVGTPCREAPDISANADEYTPYAEYCTGTEATPFSTCATFSGGQTPPGWFGIGGTSLSSPLWSAIIADRDSYHGSRTGAASVLLYAEYNINAHGYFHDITGKGQTTNNNGFFPTTPGFDLATGIGTPIMSAIITDSPAK